MALFYRDDAINHQMSHEPAEGRAATQEMFARDLVEAEMECIVENVFEDGDWAILERRDPLGIRGCSFFHVENDRITVQRGYCNSFVFGHSQGAIQHEQK